MNWGENVTGKRTTDLEKIEECSLRLGAEILQDERIKLHKREILLGVRMEYELLERIVYTCGGL